MKPYKNLVFDLDGTLWNTQDDCVIAWNAAIKAEKIDRADITREDIAGIMGFTTTEMREKLFPNLEPSKGMAFLDKCFEQEVIQIKKSASHLYAGVREGIDKLSGQSKLFIVSNCEVSYLELFFEVTGLKDFFIDSDCYGNTKLEKGKTILGLMARNQLVADDTLYIGDTLHDEQASRMAGIDFSWFDYGFGKSKEPDYKFSSFDEFAASAGSH